jgi:hypothetical protein
VVGKGDADALRIIEYLIKASFRLYFLGMPSKRIDFGNTETPNCALASTHLARFPWRHFPLGIVAYVRTGL